MKEVELKELVEINNQSLGENHTYDEIEYIDISSVGSGVLNTTTIYKPKDAPGRARRLVKNGDTILSTVRPNRRSYLYIKQPKKNYVVSTGFAVLSPKDTTDSRFLYYLVTNQEFTDYLTNAAKGSAYPAVDTEIISKAKVNIPSLLAQQKIASILSAYDDLIENNNRRIKILEEMTQAIYNEWFVKFRLPGYSKVKMVKSGLDEIPEGWEVSRFEETFITKYGKNLPTKKISQKGKYPVYGAGGIIGYYDECVIKDKVALIACRGNGSGDVSRTREAAFITNNSFMIMPIDKCSHWKYFFIEAMLKTLNIMGIRGGAAQPQITIEGISLVKTIIPSKMIVMKFTELVEPMAESIDLLYTKNFILRQTRDRLLPRLISGEMDTENLDIKVGN